MEMRQMTQCLDNIHSDIYMHKAPTHLIIIIWMSLLFLVIPFTMHMLFVVQCPCHRHRSWKRLCAISANSHSPTRTTNFTFLVQEEEAAAVVKALFSLLSKDPPGSFKMTELKNGRVKIEMNREEARQEADVWEAQTRFFSNNIRQQWATDRRCRRERKKKKTGWIIAHARKSKKK